MWNYIFMSHNFLENLISFVKPKGGFYFCSNPEDFQTGWEHFNIEKDILFLHSTLTLRHNLYECINNVSWKSCHFCVVCVYSSQLHAVNTVGCLCCIVTCIEPTSSQHVLDVYCNNAQWLRICLFTVQLYNPEGHFPIMQH